MLSVVGRYKHGNRARARLTSHRGAVSGPRSANRLIDGLFYSGISLYLNRFHRESRNRHR